MLQMNMSNESIESQQYFNLLLSNKDDKPWQVEVVSLMHCEVQIECVQDGSTFASQDDASNQLNTESSDPIFIHKENANKTIAELSEKYTSVGTETKTSKMPNRTFPYILWEMINNDESKAICWSKDGSTFFFNKSEFEKEYLESATLFKTKKFDSFIRQLNFYGFRKLTSKIRDNQNEYYHRHFVRGRPDLLASIKRNYRTRAKTDSEVAVNKGEPIALLPKPLEVCFINSFDDCLGNDL